MEINLHNYEAFFLDHKEGNLSKEQEKELFLFLEQYPYLHEELDSFENIVLEQFEEQEQLAKRSSLKKADFNNDTLIAYTEGLLDEKGKKEIEILALQNTAL